MRVRIPLLLLMLLAAAIGYLLGTERGRAQRDVILVKLGRKAGDDEVPSEETVAIDAEDTVTIEAEDTVTIEAEATEPTG